MININPNPNLKSLFFTDEKIGGIKLEDEDETQTQIRI